MSCDCNLVEFKVSDIKTLCDNIKMWTKNSYPSGMREMDARLPPLMSDHYKWVNKQDLAAAVMHMIRIRVEQSDTIKLPMELFLSLAVPPPR